MNPHKFEHRCQPQLDSRNRRSDRQLKSRLKNEMISQSYYLQNGMPDRRVQKRASKIHLD